MINLYKPQTRWLDVLDHVISKMELDDPYREDMQKLYTYLQNELPKELLNAVPAERVRVYVDGGCRNNGTPQAEAYGSYKIGTKLRRIKYPQSVARTNNEAEYQTMISALTTLKIERIRGARVFMDSSLVVNQVAGNWKGKDRKLLQLRDEAQKLMDDVGATLEWVEREIVERELGH